MATTAADLYWDPFDTALRDDPYPTWKRLRNEAPVWHNERYDFWVLSRFDDVEAAHRDPQRFSSAHGTTLEMMTPEPMEDTGFIIFQDPPRHTRMRALVSRAFTPRSIGGLEERIRSVCKRLLDAQAGNDRFDYVQSFAAVLPPTVISSLLGVPEADQDELRRQVDLIFHTEDEVGMMNETSFGAQRAVNDYLISQLTERRKSPRQDLLTTLAIGEVVEDGDGKRRLTDDEAADFGKMLFVAGSETVARLLGWAVAVLAEHPDQRDQLIADPSLLPNAVEELLRFEAPSPVQARWTTMPVEMNGITIPANAKVILLTGAAGRDERKFPDPDRFDIHRTFDHHVSLGFGIHFCLGAALARMEGLIGIGETLARYPTWSVDHDEALLLYTSTVRGYAELPILV